MRAPTADVFTRFVMQLSRMAIPSGRFVVVPDKGLDRIFSFRFEAGRLVPAAVPFVATREGAGPRNVVFHPGLPFDRRA